MSGARPADWLTIDDALDRMLAAVTPLPAERVPVGDALGRVLAEQVVSPIDQPPWDNSAMDGFAVRTGDVRGATRENPVVLEIVDDIPAGSFPRRRLGPGEAARIMTGAPVPEGAGGVVRLEHTDAWGAPAATASSPSPDSPPAGLASPPAAMRVTIYDDADADRNIRARGEDLRTSDAVLAPGHALRPADVGVLAMVGHAQVAVYRRPRVAILSNGDELVDLDAFDKVRAGRRIVNSNGYALAAAVRALGCEPIPLGIAADDRADIRRRIEAARGADALVTSAGAAVGDHDLIKEALEELGFELAFWRVKIRPGSPFSFGTLDGMPVFGLPGNPVSVLVTFHILVAPVLRRMHGRRAVYPPALTVRAGERMSASPGLVRFLRARLEPDGAGGWSARLTGPQGSGILTSMSRADALVMVPLEMETVEEGEALLAFPLTAPDDARLEWGVGSDGPRKG